MSLPSPARLLLLTRRCLSTSTLSCSPSGSARPSAPAPNKPTPPPSNGSLARRSPQDGHVGTGEGALRREPRRERYPELARLGRAEHKLSFRSLPYSSPPSLLFGSSPSSSSTQQPLQFSYTPPSRLWTLRCFPSPKRTDSRRPPSSFSSTREEEGEEMVVGRKKRPSYTMNLTLLISKKKVHKSAVVRNRCKRRIWEAIRAVVSRGARREEVVEAQGQGQGDGKEEGRVRLVEGEGERRRETGPRKWLLPGYHYTLSLSSLDIYRAVPIEQLVDELGRGLREVKRKAEFTTLSLRLDEISSSFSSSTPVHSDSPLRIHVAQDHPTALPSGTVPSLPSHSSSSASESSALTAPLCPERSTQGVYRVAREKEEEELEKVEKRVRERGAGQKSWEDVDGAEEEALDAWEGSGGKGEEEVEVL